jgi:hypothetical protein
MKQNETNLGEKGEKGEMKYHCNYCNYICSVKFSYVRHLMTAKHIKQSQMKQNETNETKKEKKEKKEKKITDNICECGQVCCSRTTLWRHKKICTVETPPKNNVSDNDDLINYLIKENQEFKNLILEIVKKDTYTTTNTNNINSHNKTFNLQFFLNETCKDAMNIMDFVESVKLQLSDLEKVGEIGYVDGISNIIVKNLKALDVEKRPVHCTDAKREILYIKDDNKWEKENEDKNKLRKVIKKIANRNSRLLPQFKEKHPDCGKSESKYSDQYNKLIVEAMGGHGDNDLEKEDKIIRKITKEVVIDKEIY